MQKNKKMLTTIVQMDLQKCKKVTFTKYHLVLPTNNTNVVRYRHLMGSIALPDCSAEAVFEQA